MRPAQLARKIGISPGDLADWLNTTASPLENSNARLSDEQVGLAIQHFAPARATELWAFVRQEPEAAETPVSAEPIVEPATEESPVVATEVPAETPPATPLPDGPIEVIKAPKVELAGLKVLGKIELPETKKKAETPEGEAGATESPREERRRDNRRRDNGRTQRRDSNPIAQQREREAREKEERRRQQLEQEKERKTNNYYKRVKPANPTRRARVVDEPVDEMPATAPPPKSLWGKFLRWLRD